jgi:hypothetical protein
MTQEVALAKGGAPGAARARPARTSAWARVRVRGKTSPMNLREGLVACTLLASTGCSHDSATIELVTDDEAGTFTQNPVPTFLQISEVTYLSDGGVSSTPLVDAALPVTSIDLGNRSQNTQAILTVTGFAADGGAVIFGASVPLDFGAINGLTIPIFVQRTGQFARLPGTFSVPDGGADTRTSPVLAVFNADYLLVAGGDQPGSGDAGTGEAGDVDAATGEAGAPLLSESTQIYDFTLLAPSSAPPEMPQPVQSIAFDDTVGWLFDADAGNYFFFSGTYAPYPFSLPAGGGAFADIAGGATIIDPSTGNEYIVGATRTSGNPSQYVLEIEPGDASTSYPYGTASWIALGTPRLGATAVWLGSQDELAIIGGNTAADAGGGVEVISGTSGIVTGLSFPADLTIGAGAVVLDGGMVLLVGGVVPGLDAGSGVDAAAMDGGTAQASDASDAAMSSGPDATLAGVDAGLGSGTDSGLAATDGASSTVSDAGSGLTATDAGSSTASDADADSDATSGVGAPIATDLRIIDPTCLSSCIAMPWGGQSLPVVLVDAQAFTADGVNVLIVGNDASGMTHVFTATSSSITEVLPRVPHNHARAIISPTQTVLLVGGSPVVESFTPSITP